MHRTVLTDEAVDMLALTNAARVVDCTFGVGGHSARILQSLGPKGQLLALDADSTAIAAASPEIVSDPRAKLRTANFKDLKQILEQEGITAVDAVLADLGWREEQFMDGGKGLSFAADEPLLMTYGDPADYLFTAHDIVNSWEENSIADVIFGYGEERAARKIAHAIVTARKAKPIETAAELAALIEATVGKRSYKSRLHPATKTFQALRIAVNDELGALKSLLVDGFEALSTGGRLAIISFHSLEDRLVKHTFRNLQHDQRGTLITKKPLVPSEEELRTNPRARSAKLRIIEKT